MKKLSKYQYLSWSLGLLVFCCLTILCFLKFGPQKNVPKVVLDDGVDIPFAQEYLHLEYILQPSKKVYVKGEPILFTLFVSNPSDKVLPVLTTRGFTNYNIAKRSTRGIKLPVVLFPMMVSKQNWHPLRPIIELQPGEKVVITSGSSLDQRIQLRDSEPGIYYACVHIDSILPGMRYVPPARSNEAEFEIVEIPLDREEECI